MTPLRERANGGWALSLAMGVAACACGHEADLARIEQGLRPGPAAMAERDGDAIVLSESPTPAAGAGEPPPFVQPQTSNATAGASTVPASSSAAVDCEGPPGHSPETGLLIGTLESLVTCSGIVEPGRPDFYLFDLSENAIVTYSARTKQPTGSVNVLLFVYAPQILSSDQLDRLAGVQPDAHRVALERGRYALRVETANQLYDLTLSAEPYAVPEPEPEPGEEPAEAVLLETSSQEPAGVSGFVGPSDVADYYRLHIGADGALRVVFTNVVGASGVKADLHRDAPVLATPLRSFTASGEGNPPASPEYSITAGDYHLVVNTSSRPGALYTMGVFYLPGS
jgi:hypothetical protein